MVRGLLPAGDGVVLDPFAGSGTTLAACEALGVHGIGVEFDDVYFSLAQGAIAALAELEV
jgi:site-specific DNA-methyltransferase (adenine-specific)